MAPAYNSSFSSVQGESGSGSSSGRRGRSKNSNSNNSPTVKSTRPLPRKCASTPSNHGALGYFCSLQDFVADSGETLSFDLGVPTKLWDEASKASAFGIKAVARFDGFLKELQAIDALSRALTPQEMLSLTTIRRVNGAVGVVALVKDAPGVPLFGLLQESCTSSQEFVRKVDLGRMCTDVSRFLDTIHGYRFVHKDIKPLNIVLCGGTYKVIDFDSLVHKTDKGLTDLHGTSEYMSPRFLYTHFSAEECAYQWSSDQETYSEFHKAFPASLLDPPARTVPVSDEDGATAQARARREAEEDAMWNKRPVYDPLQEGGGLGASDWEMMRANDWYALALTLHGYGMRMDDPRMQELIAKVTTDTLAQEGGRGGGKQGSRTRTRTRTRSRTRSRTRTRTGLKGAVKAQPKPSPRPGAKTAPKVQPKAKPKAVRAAKVPQK